MPSIFTPIPSEIERKAPGTGGKPPVDRRPTGGGGGGDDEWKHPHRGPRENLHRTRACVFIALAGDMMFFVVLVTLFYARQAGTHMDPRTFRQVGDWHPILLPLPILFLNTAVLLLSSLTMETARRHIFSEIDVLEEWLGLGRPALRLALPWIGATLVLGIAFLAGQFTAWRRLTAQGFAFDQTATPASYFFYLITGLHAAHLFGGILALLICLFVLARLKRVESRQIAVDSVAWFWHTMGFAWLVLFGVLALGQ
jgi:cytochrome c oxidase subunit III